MTDSSLPAPPIRFEEQGPLPGLPLNYVPAGLRALRREARAADLTLVAVGRGKERTRFDVAEVGDLANPGRLAERLTPFLERTFLLGLPAPADRAQREQAPRFPPAEVGGDLQERAALVVIDHGLAFWNPAFRDAAGPLFEAIQVLDLDAAGGIAGARLNKALIGQMCGLADGPHGQARVRAALGARFPGSFFGQFLDGHGLWHGTAMTDLALAEAEGARPLLFGVELPTALVEDRGGDMLTAFLPTAIDAALGMTAALHDRPLVILLAFGFTGGPQDGRHPAARAIAGRLAAARDGGRDVTLVVPAGNQRQDRCAARLGPGEGGAPGASSVGWRLPHDDFSANTVEAVMAADPPPVLWLAAPDGADAQVALAPDLFATLTRGGAVIGALHVRPLDGGDLVARLALAPTTRRAGGVPAPAGLWTVGLDSPTGAHLWILRDDPMASDRAAPHRLSSFEDGRWRDRDPNGDWWAGDRPDAVVRRQGSASVLASAAAALAVAASERRREPAAARAAFRDAAYSGLPLPGRPPPDARELVEQPAWGGAVESLGNGGRARFRVSGTSAAAARAAGRAAS